MPAPDCPECEEDTVTLTVTDYNKLLREAQESAVRDVEEDLITIATALPREVPIPAGADSEPKTYVSGGVSLPDLRDWQRHKVSVRTDRNLTLVHDSGEEITLPGTIIAENVKITANPEVPTVWVDLRLMVKSAEGAPGGTVTFTSEVTQ